MCQRSLYVNSVESFATLDGVGIRYAVFLQGCPLRCIYCHNPETWKIGGAKKTKIADLYKQIIKAKEYFGVDGGVTFSGGEPLMQAKNLICLAKKLKKAGINICLDTSGIILNNDVLKLLKFVDHVILDLKFYTNDDYKKYCGGDLDRVLAFLNALENHKIKTWLRTVIVPDINDNNKAIENYAKIAKDFECVKKYELLAFHTMGFAKYKALKIDNKLKEKQALSQEKLLSLQKYLDQLLKK